jgi:uncharacterized protein
MGKTESMALSMPGSAPARNRPQTGAARVAGMLGVWMAAWWLPLGMVLAPVLPGGWLSIGVLAAATAAPLGVLLRGFAGEHYPGATQRIWVLRPFWYAQLALPLLGLAAMAGLVGGAAFGAAGAAGRWTVLGAASVLGATAAVGYIGSRRLVVKPIEARFPDLPEGLEGTRMVQISDLHVGPQTSRRHLARVAAAVAGAEPDLIAITGDQVDDHGPDVAHFAAAFRGLSAPLGVFAVPGNHDVYAGWSQVRAGLEEMGITVLVNRSVALRRGGDVFRLAGTGDPAGSAWGRGDAAAAPDVARTVAEVPANSFVVALAHNPVLWPELARHGVQLTLSGHTHHGQLSIPRLGWSLASPFLEHAMGSYAAEGSLLYINPGTNYWGLPLRIGALPEVTVITLRRGPAAITEA